MPLLVFTDLDGTLIDHLTYRWEAAQPALHALKRIKAGVVLASSKTAPEISALRAELGLDDWPAIVENGAGVLPAHVSAIEGGGRYAELLAALDDVPADLRAKFRGFNDMGPEEVAKVTGLDPEAAVLACARSFSEPGLWSGDEEGKQAFMVALNQKGLIAQQGGRFLTLSFGGNKVDQMRHLTKEFSPLMSVALGDAPNDIAMLQEADMGIIVANPHGKGLQELPGEEIGRIVRTKKPGPKGWNEAILDLLSTRH